MDRKGFTLVELFMVIAIVVIMAAIFIPKFHSLENDAKRSRCKANVGTIKAELMTYYVKTGMSGMAVFPRSDGAGRVEFSTQYFPSATLPVCPFTAEAYTWNEETGEISNHNH